MSDIKGVFVEIYIDERCKHCSPPTNAVGAEANLLGLWERQDGFDLRCMNCGVTDRRAGLRDALEIVRTLRESADYIKGRAT